MRKLVLAVLAAWVIALPSVADAQQRGDGQGRQRPQAQQQEGRRGGGGFSGVLDGIAGPRLNRAHVDKRDRDRGGERQRGGGGGGGGGGDRNGRGR